MGFAGTVLIAVLPPVFFLVWILRYDRMEPEPLSSVLKVFLLGCLSIIPAAFMESAMLSLPVFSPAGLTGSALQSFLVIAPIEEAVKLLIVILFIRKSRHFTESNDGIVYAGTASIGFALAENLFYVFEHGALVGMARAVTSIPGHTFTGVIMGYFVGMGMFSSSPRGRSTYILKGFLAAWFLHGIYDTFVLSGTAISLMVIPLVVLNFIFGIKILRKGRALSAKQQGLCIPEIPKLAPSGGGCRKILGRTLLTLALLFWLLMIVGLLFGDMEQEYDPGTVLAGSLILTFIPLTLGIVLEVSVKKKETSCVIQK